LNDETELLIQLAKERGFKTVGFGQLTLDGYRDAMRKKIDLGAPLYTPRRTADKQFGFGATPPAKARYVDGTDYQELLPKLKSVEKLPMEGWLFKDDPDKVGVDAGYFKQEYPTMDLARIRIGTHWDEQGYPELEEGWYRMAYTCPRLPVGKRVVLRFEAVDETAWLYIDGKLTAWYDTQFPNMTWDKPFLLDVTGSLTSEGEHELVIRVGNGNGVGGIYKPVSLMIEK